MGGAWFEVRHVFQELGRRKSCRQAVSRSLSNPLPGLGHQEPLRSRGAMGWGGHSRRPLIGLAVQLASPRPLPGEPEASWPQSHRAAMLAGLGTWAHSEAKRTGVAPALSTRVCLHHRLRLFRGPHPSRSGALVTVGQSPDPTSPYCCMPTSITWDPCPEPGDHPVSLPENTGFKVTGFDLEIHNLLPAGVTSAALQASRHRAQYLPRESPGRSW